MKRATPVFAAAAALTMSLAAQRPAGPPVPDLAPLGIETFVESPTTGPDAPRFEVASIKPAAAGAQGKFGRTLPGGRIQNTNMTLLDLIRQAYGLRLTDEILVEPTAPKWVDTDGFDVEAKASERAAVAQSLLMMRTLLAERFTLDVRRESRELPVYALTIVRADGSLGPALKRPSGACAMVTPGGRLGAAAGFVASAEPAKPNPGPGQAGRRCGISPSGQNMMQAGSVEMKSLVTMLGPGVDRPIIDKTGLRGAFDFNLRYAGSMMFPGRGRGTLVAPDAAAAIPDPADAPSIFTALQEQLGLKLLAQRGTVDILVVYHAERPAPN